MAGIPNKKNKSTGEFLGQPKKNPNSKFELD
jgi:hypothetical protein